MTDLLAMLVQELGSMASKCSPEIFEHRDLHLLSVFYLFMTVRCIALQSQCLLILLIREMLHDLLVLPYHKFPRIRFRKTRARGTGSL